MEPLRWDFGRRRLLRKVVLRWARSVPSQVAGCDRRSRNQNGIPALRCRAELDPVSHASPRSALTSSQGMVPCSAISARAASAASTSAKYLRRLGEPLQVLDVDHRGHAATPAGQEDGLMSGADVVDDLIELATRNRDRQVEHSPSMGEGRSFHALSPRSDSGSASPLPSLR